MFAMTAVVNQTFPLVAIDQGLTVARKRAIKHFGIAVLVAVAAVVFLNFK
jgi:hypothetical protein